MDSEQVISELESDFGGWEEKLWRSLKRLPDISDSERQDFISDRRPGALRPYFPRRLYDADFSFVGELPAYRGLGKRYVDTGAGAAAIGRHLLYCDTVAIDDPLYWVVCDGVGFGRTGDQYNFTSDDRMELSGRRWDILKWLDLVRYLRPLLTSGRLLVVPFSLSHYWWGEPPRDIQLDDEDRGHLRSEVRERLLDDLRYDDEDVEFWTQGLAIQALKSMSVQLQASLYFGAALDVAPTRGSHVVALRRLLEHGETSVPRQLASNVPRAPAHLSALQVLSGLPVHLQPGTDVPRLIGLAADDEAFASWREGLARALHQIESLDASKPTYDSSVRDAFASNLHAPVRLIRREREKATWGQAIKPPVSRIALSGASYLGALGLATVFGDPLSLPFSVAGATAVGGATALWSYARGSAARTQGAAVESLFAELTGGVA